jgi:glycosyltransferase 2 family protein
MSRKRWINGLDLKRAALVLVGVVLGVFFFYMAFRDISWRDLKDGISQMQPIYFVPCAVLMILIQLVRALRFGVILSPFCRLPTKDLWDLLNVWAGATMIMPARLGELVRPYLLRRYGASFSSGIGAVMVERFFDLSSLLLLLGVVLWTTPEAPHIFTVTGTILLIALVTAYVLIWLILTRRDSFNLWVNRLTSWLPERGASFLQGMMLRFIDGFGIMVSIKQVLLIGLYSILIWLFFAIVTYLFLLSFSVKAPFLVAVTVHVFICIAVALPSPPGFIGTFHAACRYALSLFGISAVVAVSFATVYHLFSVVICLLLGLISYLTANFRLEGVLSENSPDAVEPAVTNEFGQPEEFKPNP